jgi:hypothetical protein
MPTLWGQKITKIFWKCLSSLIPPFLVEDRMTFWKWTFLKYDKCPNLISSKKCFLGALKNLEESIGFIVALKMLRKTTILYTILEKYFGLFWTFLDFFGFGSFGSAQ